MTAQIGRTIPLLGFGVYQNRDKCTEGCLTALKAGYRFVVRGRVSESVLSC